MDQAVAGGALTGRRIVIPESRALDLFSDMIARHGAEVVRCPLVTTARLKDNQALDAWIGRAIDGRHDLVVFYTGEGVTKIVERAEETGASPALLESLKRVPKLARGPKPLSALRKLAIEMNVTRAAAPTTDGLLETLGGLDLAGKTVAVQLYPDGPEERLADALDRAGASFDPVLPYEYVSDEADERVAEVIAEMAEGRVDLIAFTSQSQVQRLIEVAERRSQRAELDRAFAQVSIAAVGPVTQQAVTDAGAQVDIQPAESFHMKPLVAEIVRKLGPKS